MSDTKSAIDLTPLEQEKLRRQRKSTPMIGGKKMIYAQIPTPHRPQTSLPEPPTTRKNVCRECCLNYWSGRDRMPQTMIRMKNGIVVGTAPPNNYWKNILNNQNRKIMSREIRFRVWDVQAMRMIVPDMIPNNSIGCVPEDDDEQFFVHMQYTGLKDKNGKEIYEGDILKYKYSRDRSGTDIKYFTDVVEWDDYDNYAGFSISQKMEHEVIGNKFENPELLTQPPTIGVE